MRSRRSASSKEVGNSKKPPVSKEDARQKDADSSKDMNRDMPLSRKKGSGRNKSSPKTPPSSEVYLGMKIENEFLMDGKTIESFKGKVIGKPVWKSHRWFRRVRYDDGDERVIDEQEILDSVVKTDRTDNGGKDFEVNDQPDSLGKDESDEDKMQSNDRKRASCADQDESMTTKKSRLLTDGEGEQQTDSAEQEEEDGQVEKAKPPAKKCAQPSKAKTKGRSEVRVGLTFKKLFNDGDYYEGEVIEGPLLDDITGTVDLWNILYDDGDRERLRTEDIEKCLQHERNKNYKKWPYAVRKATTKESALKALCAVHFSETEVSAVLDEMDGPPYGLMTAADAIYKHRERLADQLIEEGNSKFQPEIGTRIHKHLGGKWWYGRITRLPEDGSEREKKTWRVMFDDGGDIEDMSWEDLLCCRADRPVVPDPLEGRPLAALELFSGCGIVTQEFAARQWKVQSVDIDPQSNATNKISIMDLKAEKECFGLGTGFGVPDFIWASPDCRTFSNLPAGMHRESKSGRFEKTPDAHESNTAFARMGELMLWAVKRHPHCVVVIENPEAKLRSMPLMKHLEKVLKLHRAKVDYCALGRHDKKPTNLWTNDLGLLGRFGCYTCERSSCPYTNTKHPEGVRKNGHKYNAAEIPVRLARLVAKYVDSTFCIQGIQERPQAKS